MAERPPPSARLGALVGAALAGAWRRTPPPFDGSAGALDAVTPLLLGSGGGGLGWWRIRESPLAGGAAGRRLRAAHRLHALEAARHEAPLVEVLGALRAAAIEPILVKGWAVARHYPGPGLRPYGDIDLCVRPPEVARALDVLGIPAGVDHEIDVHRGFDKLDALSFDALLARSAAVALGDVTVRVLGWEDHLRVLCAHLLRHGAFRPLWLCDVACMLESRPAHVDWARLLGPDPRRAGWTLCAIGLARHLLGAELGDAPPAVAAATAPAWLVRRTLENWSRPFADEHAPGSLVRPIGTYLRRPRGVLRALAARWPDPIQATVRSGGTLACRTPLGYQLATLAGRIGRKLAPARLGSR